MKEKVLFHMNKPTIQDFIDIDDLPPNEEQMMKAAGFTHDSVDNQSVDWYTPKWIFDELDIKFDLDPCHPKQRIPWIPVEKHYSLEDDGLKSPWFGNVWLNPPYGKETSIWLEKMHNHRNGIALVFARTDCQWYHNYVTRADGLLFLKGRIRFVDGLGVTKGGGAGSGSMLISWGEANTNRLKQISDRGHFIPLDELKKIR